MRTSARSGSVPFLQRRGWSLKEPALFQAMFPIYRMFLPVPAQKPAQEAPEAPTAQLFPKIRPAFPKRPSFPVQIPEALLPAQLPERFPPVSQRKLTSVPKALPVRQPSPEPRLLPR